MSVRSDTIIKEQKQNFNFIFDEVFFYFIRGGFVFACFLVLSF